MSDLPHKWTIEARHLLATLKRSVVRLQSSFGLEFAEHLMADELNPVLENVRAFLVQTRSQWDRSAYAVQVPANELVFACIACRDPQPYSKDWAESVDSVIAASSWLIDELDRLKPEEKPVDAGSEAAADDDSAYVPAKDLYQLRGMTAAQCNAMLKKHPSIRTRKPSKNRLLIHAGDWLRHWAEQDRLRSDSLDAETIDAMLADQEATKAEIRKKRRRK